MLTDQSMGNLVVIPDSSYNMTNKSYGEMPEKSIISPENSYFEQENQFTTKHEDEISESTASVSVVELPNTHTQKGTQLITPKLTPRVTPRGNDRGKASYFPKNKKKSSMRITLDLMPGESITKHTVAKDENQDNGNDSIEDDLFGHKQDETNHVEGSVNKTTMKTHKH